jgi:predicted metal-binding membrane protein
MGGVNHSPRSVATVPRDSVTVAVLLTCAAGAWAVTLLLSRGMRPMPGTMGLGLVVFIGAWTLMMAAMMLPAAAPVIRLYARTLPEGSPGRLVQFGAGYLLVWVLAGLPAFGLATAAEVIATQRPGLSRWAAAGTFVIVAGYQLTPFKAACLRACRSPLGLLLRYAGGQGQLRELRAGSHLGLYCLGCCWALFAALIVVGLMNVAAMVGLAVIVAGEKLWARGEVLTRVVAALAVGLAALVLLHPALAGGLYAGPTPTMM